MQEKTKEKYNRGKVYKLITPDNYYYIGSTCCKYLSQRLSVHRSNAPKYPNRKIYKRIKDFTDVKIILLLNYPCKKSKEELHAKEQEFINLNRDDHLCLNSIRAFLTEEEKKEYMRKYKREYQQKPKNKQHIRKYMQEYMREYEQQPSRKEYMQKYMQEYMQKYEKQKINCDCGAVITKGALSFHKRKCKKHLEWLNNNTIEQEAN